jgi:hypothetical protein
LKLKPSVVCEIKSHFRVLDGWQIDYDDVSVYKAQCCCNVLLKQATIYGWGELNPMPDDYFMHEVLHVAFKAANSTGRDGEELFVQDLCKLLGSQ